VGAAIRRAPSSPDPKHWRILATALALAGAVVAAFVLHRAQRAWREAAEDVRRASEILREARFLVFWVCRKL
jgi:hypothetical protein